LPPGLHLSVQLQPFGTFTSSTLVLGVLQAQHQHSASTSTFKLTDWRPLQHHCLFKLTN
jgi:hypothetical protein